MIRTNLVALLIVAALGWAIDGFVEAATPVSPSGQRHNVTELLNIVKPSRVDKATSQELEGRTPAVKPSVLYWPEDAPQARLMVKFNDRYRVRLDPAGQVISRSGENIDSLGVILEGLKVTLEPVFTLDESEIETVIRRAERLSGKVQPDIAANFYVNGDPGDIEQAAMVLLHDPRVEWAAFNTRKDPRVAIARRDAGVDMAPGPVAATPAAATPTLTLDRPGPSLNPVPSLNVVPQYIPGQEMIYDGAGTLTSSEPKVVETGDLRVGSGSCCVFEDDASIVTLPFPNQGSVYVAGCFTAATQANCDDFEGIFTKGFQCSNSQAANFTNCDTPLIEAQGWERTGACCTAGDIEIVVKSDCDGDFLHDLVTRFEGNRWNPTTTPVPPWNTGLNVQLLASAYGLTNFAANNNYSYHTGIPFVLPPLAAAALDPFNDFPANGAIVDYNTSPYNINSTSANPAIGYQVAGTYQIRLIDRQLLNAAGTPTGAIATGNGVFGFNNPNSISGGLILGDVGTTGKTYYNPNYILAADESSSTICEYGICALDCWENDPASGNICGPETTASAANTSTLSPILGPALIPPTTNVRCSSFVYKSVCDSMQFRSAPNADFNPTGSLWQNLITGQPQILVAAGCQSENDPANSDTLVWWRDFRDFDSDVCCPGEGPDCEYETYEPEDEGDILRGDCSFSNASYPTMLINQAGQLQLQGLGESGATPPFYDIHGCYGGGGKVDADLCAVYCSDQDTIDQVCAVAPICCDDSLCDDDFYFPYSGWSFMCADLASQLGVGAGLAGTLLTDFNQSLKVGGPYPQYNPLGLETPVLRNLDGTILDTNPALPGVQPAVIPAPPSCKINYGVQNQCFSAYFSEFQPSLGLAPGILLPPFSIEQTTGCTDFECCHRICSIFPTDPVTGFNYANCCTVAWTQECVDKAQEICYTDEGGIVSTTTPDFAPLQFHLSQKTARGPRPISSFSTGMRRLAAAPMMPPSVISPVPGNPSVPSDNWLQSVHQVQWIRNPLLITNNQPADFNTALATSVAIPSVLGQRGLPGLVGGLVININPNTGAFVPRVSLDPTTWDQFYYGELPSSPVSWFESQGLSLYGNDSGQGWPTNPSFLSYSFGLYSWGTYIADIRPGNHPWGPYVNGTAGAGVKVAVLDSSAWIQEYVNEFGIVQGAVHEDLGSVLMEGPIIGAAPVPMLFDPFVSYPQRGTAVLGTIAATVNGVGTDGIAPMAMTMFFPTQSSENGDRELMAWLTAISRLTQGDVLVATYPGGGDSDCIFLDRGLILGGAGILELTENLQISVVLPLGDYGLDIQFGELPDNIFLAAASLPSRLPRRYWTSNYSGTDTGNLDTSPISCAMAPITTTGGDCNLTRISIDTEPDTFNDPSGYISRDMMRRSYTNDFGNLYDGSKAAAAQLAGVVACLQGLSLQWYGGPQPSLQLRNLIAESRRIAGALPNAPADASYPVASFGVPATGHLNAWEFDLDNDAEAPNIGGFLDPARAGVSLVIDPQYEVIPSDAQLYSAYFIRGFQLYGTHTSLNIRFDYEYLSGLSQFTEAGLYEPNQFVPGTPIAYFPSGEYTDLFVHGIAPNKDFSAVPGISVDVTFEVTPDGIEGDLSLPEGLIYDFEFEGWVPMLLGDDSFEQDGVFTLVYNPEDLNNDGNFGEYFGPSSEFNLRFVVTAPSVDPDSPFSDGFGADPYVIYYDYIDLRQDGVADDPDGP